MLNKMKRLVVEEQGQGMTEYGLVLGGIAIGAIAVLALLKDKIVAIFDSVLTSITGAGL